MCETTPCGGAPAKIDATQNNSDEEKPEVSIDTPSHPSQAEQVMETESSADKTAPSASNESPVHSKTSSHRHHHKRAHSRSRSRSASPDRRSVDKNPTGRTAGENKSAAEESDASSVVYIDDGAQKGDDKRPSHGGHRKHQHDKHHSKRERHHSKTSSRDSYYDSDSDSTFSGSSAEESDEELEHTDEVEVVENKKERKERIKIDHADVDDDYISRLPASEQPPNGTGSAATAASSSGASKELVQFTILGEAKNFINNVIVNKASIPKYVWSRICDPKRTILVNLMCPSLKTDNKFVKWLSLLYYAKDAPRICSQCNFRVRGPCIAVGPRAHIALSIAIRFVDDVVDDDSGSDA